MLDLGRKTASLEVSIGKHVFRRVYDAPLEPELLGPREQIVCVVLARKLLDRASHAATLLFRIRVATTHRGTVREPQVFAESLDQSLPPETIPA